MKLFDNSGVLSRIFHLVFALIALYAVITGAIATQDDKINYFSFFTVICSILLSCTYLYIAASNSKNKNLDILRGAVNTNVIIAGIVFSILFRDVQVDDRVANTILHTIMPLVAFSEWVLFSSKKILKIKTIFIWYLVPSAYFIFALIRGSIINWYPYPFLDPGNGINALIISIFIMSLAYLIISAFMVRVANIITKLKSRST